MDNSKQFIKIVDRKKYNSKYVQHAQRNVRLASILYTITALFSYRRVEKFKSFKIVTYQSRTYEIME